MLFFKDLLGTLLDRTTNWLKNSKVENRSIEELCFDLLSSKGEVSAMSLSKKILDYYLSLDEKEKINFFLLLIEKMDLDLKKIDKALDAYKTFPNHEKYHGIIKSTVSNRSKLFNRLNQSSGATSQLVKMRSDILKLSKFNKKLSIIDLDLKNLFISWFNRGFLVLRPITWESPADILEKIINYEAVHTFNNWEDLKSRLEPSDRKCYAFFHPAMPNEPLIFVQIALTSGIPNSIQNILSEKREILSLEKANTATFYSISNCQHGLQGISFGNSLIKTVVQEISRNFPKINNFVTLSPIPNFTNWLKTINIKIENSKTKKNIKSAYNYLKNNPKFSSDFAAHYLINIHNENGSIVDPVAKFHLTNGAIIHEIHDKADISERGIKQSNGHMVNYLYNLEKVTENHEKFVVENKIMASEKLLKKSKSIEKLINF